MSPHFKPVGAGLPPRRDSSSTANDVVHAAAVPGTDLDPLSLPPSAAAGPGRKNIVVAKAQDRPLEAFERIMDPRDVAAILQGALNGDLRDQARLYQAMLDTWPDLQAAVAKVAEAVATLPWQVIPFAERGEEPTAEAQRLAAQVDRLLWRMGPDVTRGERDLEDTIKDIVMGYFGGHYAAEVRWTQDLSGAWRPRATQPLPARYYGYPSEGDDQLQLDPTGQGIPSAFQPFPAHRFLVAINRAHPGHATVAAPFRSLVGYWLAAVYGLRWFMTFTQLFGVPFRWAECATEDDIGRASEMLAAMGSSGTAAVRAGTKLNFEPAPASGSSLPQAALVELANEQCAKFILGQTLTSTVADSGSRALGEVHQDTESLRIASIADFAGKVITRQLIPALLYWNYGEVPAEAPEFWPPRTEAKDEMAMAQRDKLLGLGTAALPVGRAWFYERHGIPLPQPGEELLTDPVEDDNASSNSDSSPTPAAPPQRR